MKEAEFFTGPPPPDDNLPPKKKPKGPTPKIEVASTMPPSAPADPDDPGALLQNMLGALEGIEVEEGGVDLFIHNTTLEAQRLERMEARRERQAKRGKKGKRRQ